MKNTIKRLKLESDTTLLYLSEQKLRHCQSYRQTIVDFVAANQLATHKTLMGK